MLQIAPETSSEEGIDTDDAVYCAGCKHLLTRTRWAIDMDGHERVFINPAGRVFRIQCYREAPGVTDQGTPTEEHSWFPGYAWNFALCRGCGAHLGWRFTGKTEPRVFFGFIKTALTQTPG